MELPKPAPSTGGGGSSVGADNYLKVEDGDSVTVVFRGMPYLYYQLWRDGQDKKILTEPEAGAKPRYLWNTVLWDAKQKKFVAKVWDMAGPTYELLFKINGHSPLESTKVEIGRKGTRKNTRWTIIPVGAVDPKGLKSIEAVNLHILHREASADESAGEAATEEDADEVPF